MEITIKKSEQKTVAAKRAAEARISGNNKRETGGVNLAFQDTTIALA